MMKRSLGLVSLLLVLACGGLFDPPKPTVRKNPYENDQAERARLRREYSRAEAMLKARLKEKPTDDVARVLLGDVNLTRGQDFVRKWQENLQRAFDSYAKLVALEPENCVYWGRVATAVEMARIAEGTRIPREAIEALPLEEGWKNCASAAMLSLTLAREPTETELEDAKKLLPKGTRWEQLDKAAPWLKEGFDRVPLDQVTWEEPPASPVLGAGSTFVVLEPPLTALGQGHENHRPVAGMEIFSASRVSGDRAVFTDRRFPKLLPQKGVVLAKACKNTQWRDEGIDKVPTGTCSTAAFLRAESPVWGDGRLKIAGPAHYTEASAAVGKVPADQIYWETGVRCLGGRIQRKIEYTPTCPVEFDQPNWLVRSLPVSKVVPARDEAHANQMIEAKGMAPILGTELSERMVKGQVGIGMPYGLFRYAFPDLKGCQGRALLNRHVLNGGQVDFACVLDGVAFHFTDLQLVWMGPPDELGKPPSADDEDVIE